jgi:hypothetical protein
VLAYHGVLNDEGEEVDGAALYGVAQDVHLLAHVPRLHPPVSTSFGTGSSRRKIRQIENNAKPNVVYLSGAPSPHRFLFGGGKAIL